MNIKIQEKLTLYRTLIAIFWTSSFVLGGGLYVIVSKIGNLFYLIIFIFGLLFEITIFSFAVGLIFRCKTLIKNLKE